MKLSTVLPGYTSLFQTNIVGFLVVVFYKNQTCIAKLRDKENANEMKSS